MANPCKIVNLFSSFTIISKSIGLVPFNFESILDGNLRQSKPIFSRFQILYGLFWALLNLASAFLFGWRYASLGIVSSGMQNLDGLMACLMVFMNVNQTFITLSTWPKSVSVDLEKKKSC